MEKSEVSELTEIENQQLRYMRQLVRANRLDQQVLRGCIFGLFSALGTTLGVTIVLFVAVQLISGIRNWPIVSEFLQQTKLDYLIEKQLAALTGTTSTTEYKDEVNKVHFSYPQYFTRQINTQVSTTDREYELIFEGNGALAGLEVYVNDSIVFTANGSAESFGLEDGSNYLAYYSGARVDGIDYESAVFYYEKQLGDNKIIVIGRADQSSPRIGREVFEGIIKSVK